jgi:formate dehydrogenase major subunit
VDRPIGRFWPKGGDTIHERPPGWRETSMLRKTQDGLASGPRMTRVPPGVGNAIDRRTFLKRSGVVAAGATVAAAAPPGLVRRAEAETPAAGAQGMKTVKSV